jgi:hypothetical protein
MKALTLFLLALCSGCATPQFNSPEEEQAYYYRQQQAANAMMQYSQQMQQQQQGGFTNCTSTPNVFGGYNTSCR